jgi:hypothetical protein
MLWEENVEYLPHVPDKASDCPLGMYSYYEGMYSYYEFILEIYL